MITKNKRIIFLYYGPHPFHKGIANILNALEIDTICRKKNYIRRIIDYFLFSLIYNANDILLCEGTFLIPSIFKLIFPIRNFQKYIINISADPLLYYLKNKRINLIKRFLVKKSLKVVDLFICVGDMEAELLKDIYPEAKFIIVYPYIEQDKYYKLLSLPLKEEFNHNIIFIGSGPDHWCKGIDLLFETFIILKKQVRDSNLFILGNWDEKIKRKYKYEGINFIGYSSIYEYLEICSLCLHLGRGDAFPVSVIESLLGGVPCIVSQETGVKVIVEKICKDFVVPLEPLEIVKKIIQYFNLNNKTKKTLAQKGRELCKIFNIHTFLNTFENVLKLEI